MTISAMATGGAGVTRLDDGRVVFVQGAVQGDEVRLNLTRQKRRFVHAEVAEVVHSSPKRRIATCRHIRNGQCGGCDWAHIDHSAQLTFKEQIVREQLERLGGITTADIKSVEHVSSAHLAGRTTVRATLRNGKASFLKRRSHNTFTLKECAAVHPWIQEVLLNADFGDGSKVTIRVGSATSELIIITDGSAQSVDLIGLDMGLLGDVHIQICELNQLAYHHEIIAGHPWRISSRSFFQTSAVGAETLVATVKSVYERPSQIPLERVGDLYGGGGLLAAAAPNNIVVSVESNPYSSADARVNLADHIDVVNEDVLKWKPVQLDCVIADPAREGLKRGGVETIAATKAKRVILISCDPASLGRDTALLVEAGFSYVDSQLVDMFPDTSRIEVVTHFERL